MRSPGRRRPQRRKMVESVPERVDLADLAESVSYVGSPEHKRHPSFAGPARPRADASQCDPSFRNRRDEIDSWLREGIRSGRVGEPWEGRFPRYVWYRDGGCLYEARLVNRESGEYKGYALQADEWPEGFEGDSRE